MYIIGEQRMVETNNGFFAMERKRKKIFAIIGIVLIFSLVSASAYSANSIFINLNDEIELMETDMHNLQNTINITCTELNQTRNNLK